MRHPSWRGLRTDRDPSKARRQAAPTGPRPLPRPRPKGRWQHPMGSGGSRSSSATACARTASFTATTRSAVWTWPRWNDYSTAPVRTSATSSKSKRRTRRAAASVLRDQRIPSNAVMTVLSAGC